MAVAKFRGDQLREETKRAILEERARMAVAMGYDRHDWGSWSNQFDGAPSTVHHVLFHGGRVVGAARVLYHNNRDATRFLHVGYDELGRLFLAKSDTGQADDRLGMIMSSVFGSSGPVVIVARPSVVRLAREYCSTISMLKVWREGDLPAAGMQAAILYPPYTQQPE